MAVRKGMYRSEANISPVKLYLLKGIAFVWSKDRTHVMLFFQSRETANSASLTLLWRIQGNPLITSSLLMWKDRKSKL